MEIMERLQCVMREIFDDNTLEIREQTNANDIENWDSLAHIELVMAVETEFGIKFSLGELQELKDVGEMANLIRRKIS